MRFASPYKLGIGIFWLLRALCSALLMHLWSPTLPPLYLMASYPVEYTCLVVSLLGGLLWVASAFSIEKAKLKQD